MSELSKRRLKTWIRLLRASRTIEAQLRERLRQDAETTMPRFDVLAALHRADRPLTMSTLSRQLLVSNGNTTTVVERLVADGLVRRTSSPTDRRQTLVTLTPVGRRRFEKWAASHEDEVDALFDGLGAAELGELDTLLHRLVPPDHDHHRTDRL